MLNNFSRLLLVLVIACVPALTFAQTNQTAHSPGASIPQISPLQEAKSTFLPASNNLLKYGVRFYDFTIDSKQMVINLYDESKSLLASVQLSEDSAHQGVLYKIHSADSREAWIRVNSQQVKSDYLFTINSSDSEALKLRISTGANGSNNKKVSITALSMYEGRRWVKLAAPNRKSAEKGHLKTPSISEIEQKKVFTTP